MNIFASPRSVNPLSPSHFRMGRRVLPWAAVGGLSVVAAAGLFGYWIWMMGRINQPVPADELASLPSCQKSFLRLMIGDGAPIDYTGLKLANQRCDGSSGVEAQRSALEEASSGR